MTTPARDDAAGWRKEALKNRKALKDLVCAVTQALDALDAIYVGPPLATRGKDIAGVLNALNLHNDLTKRFALGDLNAKPARSARGRRRAAPSPG